MNVVPLPVHDAAPADTAPGAGPRLAIEIRGLAKTYAGRGKSAPKVALKGIDLEVPRGAFFGLLGPNGAGKSTLINILAGLVNKSAGTARIWDHDIDTERRAAKMAIGIVPQELNIDPFFTPKQLLDLQSGLYGLKKIGIPHPGNPRGAEPVRQGPCLFARPVGRHAPAAADRQGNPP